MGGHSDGKGAMKRAASSQLALGEKQQALGEDQLNFSKEQYADNKAFTQRVLDVQLPAMQEQLKAGAEDRARYLKYFAPLETKFAEDAAGYDTPARREAEAGRATADVASAAEQTRQNAAMQLESYGVDPSMTRAAAIDRQMGIATAANEAAAANQARLGVEDRGNAMRQAAINVGRGLPGQSLSETQGAVGSGTAATGTQLAPGTVRNQGVGVASSMFGNASSAMSGGAQTYSGINQMANQTPWLDLFGTVAGTAAGAYAGKKMAEGGTPGDPGDTPVGVRVEPDSVPAIIGKHEFVVPSDVVIKKGTEFLHKMVQKAREADKVGVAAAKDQAKAGPLPTNSGFAPRERGPYGGPNVVYGTPGHSLPMAEGGTPEELTAPDWFRAPQRVATGGPQ